MDGGVEKALPFRGLAVGLLGRFVSLHTRIELWLNVTSILPVIDG